MKNLLIYIGLEPKFSEEHEVLTKIQIDNSLELGWKIGDILLVTDFPWKYRGVKSCVVKGNFNALDGNRSSKISVINSLFDMGKIRDGDVVWFHDHDAFQLEPMKELKLYPKVAAFTIDQKSKGWNAGSFFFTRGAVDMFQKIYTTMMERGTNEQDALTYLWQQKTFDDYMIMDDTFNLGIYHQGVYDRPLMVAHFHPHKQRHLNLFRDLIPNRLLEIFKEYGLE